MHADREVRECREQETKKGSMSGGGLKAEKCRGDQNTCDMTVKGVSRGWVGGAIGGEGAAGRLGKKKRRESPLKQSPYGNAIRKSVSL